MNLNDDHAKKHRAYYKYSCSLLLACALLVGGCNPVRCVRDAKKLDEERTRSIVLECLKEQKYALALRDTLQKMQEEQQKRDQEVFKMRLKEAMAMRGSEVFNSSYAIKYGQDGALKVVFFFDPYCLHCRQAFDSAKTLAQKGKIQVFLIALPMLGKDSITAVRWLHAAHTLGKGFEACVYIMSQKKSSTQDLGGLLQSIGSKRVLFNKILNNQDFEKSKELLTHMAKTLFVQGVPTMISEKGDLVLGAKDAAQVAADLGVSSSDDKNAAPTLASKENAAQNAQTPEDAIEKETPKEAEPVLEYDALRGKTSFATAA